MAKVNVETSVTTVTELKPVQRQVKNRTVTLTLNEREATILQELLGRCSPLGNQEFANFLDIYDLLYEEGFRNDGPRFLKDTIIYPVEQHTKNTKPELKVGAKVKLNPINDGTHASDFNSGIVVEINSQIVNRNICVEVRDGNAKYPYWYDLSEVEVVA